MLNPRRLLTIDATAYPSAASVTRDEYNTPVAGVGAPVAVKCWAHQTTSTENTTDTNQATAAWTVYVMPAEGVEWDALADFDHASRLVIPALQLNLKCSGQPTPWVHPPTGQLSYLEVDTLTADDDWVS